VENDVIDHSPQYRALHIDITLKITFVQSNQIIRSGQVGVGLITQDGLAIRDGGAIAGVYIGRPGIVTRITIACRA